MQVNSINNSQCRQSFGAIYYDGAERTLQKAMNSKELQEFKSIVGQQAENTLSGITLFGRGKKLDANVYTNISGKLGSDFYVCTQHSQRFYESAINFVKRMAKKADKLEVKASEELEKSNIINNL